MNEDLIIDFSKNVKGFWESRLRTSNDNSRESLIKDFIFQATVSSSNSDVKAMQGALFWNSNKKTFEISKSISEDDFKKLNLFSVYPTFAVDDEFSQWIMKVSQPNKNSNVVVSNPLTIMPKTPVSKSKNIPVPPKSVPERKKRKEIEGTMVPPKKRVKNVETQSTTNDEFIDTANECLSIGVRLHSLNGKSGKDVIERVIPLISKVYEKDIFGDEIMELNKRIKELEKYRTIVDNLRKSLSLS